MNDANGAHTGVKARLDDRLGVSAVTYLLFGVKLSYNCRNFRRDACIDW